MMPCLRMSFCEIFKINFDGAPEADLTANDVCDRFFGDLFAPNTVVETLSFIRMPWSSLERAVRKSPCSLMCYEGSGQTENK